MIRFLWNSVTRAFGYIIDHRRLSLTVFVIAFVTVQSFLNTSFITADYFRKFKVGPATAFDSDYRKLLASNLPVANIIELLRRENITGELTLVFRQAEFGYYSGLPFAYIYDNTYADLFEKATPAQLYAKLRSKNIKYLLTPDYAMPEFYNTGFADFVADLSFSEQIYEQQGYKLTRLRDQPIESSAQKIITSADFTKSPQSMRKWQLGRQPSGMLQQLSTEKAKLVFNESAGMVQLIRKKSYHSRPYIVDVLQPNPLRPKASPFLLGQSDFEPKGNTFSVEVDVEGRGYFELVVAGYARANILEESNELVVWSGVLDGERRTVRGRFTDIIPKRTASNLAEDERRYRVYLRLQDGTELDLRSWKVRTLTEDSPALDFVNRYQAALDMGWDFGDRQARFLYFGVIADDKKELDQSNEPWVQISQYDSSLVGVRSPLFYVPPSTYRDMDRINVLDTLARQINPAIHTTFELSGHGAVGITALVYCRNFDGSDPALAATAISLGTRILLDTTRSDKTTFLSSCLPSFIRYDITVKRNRFMAKADNALSDIRFRNLKTSLSFATPDQTIRKVELIPVTRLIAKNMFTSPDVTGDRQPLKAILETPSK
jgi:hypothetical protein